MLEISDGPTVNVELDAVAVLEWLGCDRGDLVRKVDFPDAAQYFTERGNLLLHFERVFQMLIMTAAAALKIGAGRGNARRGGRQHFQQAAAKNVILDALDFRAHHLARGDVGNQNHPAILPRQALAAVDELFYCENFSGGQTNPTLPWMIQT